MTHWIYDRIGADSRRSRWLVNFAALGFAFVLSDRAGWIDLSGASIDVLSQLPQGSRIVVSLIAMASIAIIVLAVSDHEMTDIRWVVAAIASAFFLVDLFYVHPEVWRNTPAMFYWLAKPIWVAGPMFGALWFLTNRSGWGIRSSLVLSAVFGVVVLQLYYTVIPIPVVGGESIQVGLIGNLTEGVAVHGIAIVVALIGVVGLMQIGDRGV